MRGSLVLRVALAGAVGFPAGAVPIALLALLDRAPPAMLAALIALPLMTGGAALAAALHPARWRRLALIGGFGALILLPAGFLLGTSIDSALVPHRLLDTPAATMLQGMLWLAPGGAFFGALVGWCLRDATARFAVAGAAGFGLAGGLALPAIIPLYRQVSGNVPADAEAAAMALLLGGLLGVCSGLAFGIARAAGEPSLAAETAA